MSINLIAETEDICAPPTVEQNKMLASIRVPSTWERVMKAVGVKSSSNKKGKGRIVGINASQDSPIDTEPTGSIMNILKGSRMRISQGQGQITPTSPSTPTSKPPSSVVEEQFHFYMKDYIYQCTNVLGDVNCEFRVVALAIYGSKDERVRVRRDMLDDLRNRPQLYHNIIDGLTTLLELDDKISHFDCPAPPEKWMTLPECGHVVETTYNVIFMTFSDIGGCTYLPTTLDRTRRPLTMKVVLRNVDNNNH
ncbi:hypothetical protein LIER_03635 [Lithospermum erythrorhizon]|uniref:Uncharacterized protein n=1 Tax=Lithospermum erythrorhizon TaxID=34254 RepID=A0AAV3NXU5_LITER